MNAKKIKALAIFTEKRIPLLPGVPTIKEAGYTFPSGLCNLYFGTFVPRGTPKEATARLSEAIRKACENPEFKELVERQGFVVSYVDTKDFEVIVEDCARTRWNLLKKLGIL